MIRNRVTGDCYIGSSVNMRLRWARHRHILNKKPDKASRKLLHAWRKYGEQAFEFRVLLTCPASDCERYEQLMIDTFKPRYNTRLIAAGSNYGIKWPAEVTAKKWAHHATKTVRGVTGTIVQLAQHFGVVTPKVAHRRISKGWSVEDAVLTPLNERVKARRVAAAQRRERLAQQKAEWEASMEKYIIDGVEATLSEHVRARGATSFFVAYARIKKYGWEPERAVLTPSNPRGKAPKKYKVFGEELSGSEIESRYGVPKATFVHRIRGGMTPEEAVTKPVRKWTKRADSN